MTYTSSLYIFGCAVLTTTSFPSIIKQRLGLPGLVISMLFIGLGGGGFRAIVVPLTGLFSRRFRDCIQLTVPCSGSVHT